MAQRAGTLVLAAFLVVLGIAGVGSAYAMAFVPGFGTPLLAGLALLYAVTAFVAAVGLWRRRPWAFRAFLLWVGAVSLFLIVTQLALQAPWASWFAFVAVAGAVLYLLARYVRKASTVAL